MFGEIRFELFQESDAQQVADLLNRNRFHTARNKHMTAEDYLFTQRSRGVYFSIVAKKKGKIIGMAGAYPTSDQQVAKKHQIFIGTFLVDMQYRLTYTVIMGLYDALMKELAKTGCKEILSGVRPQNEGSYHLMLKCGFVLLDETPNDFGRIGLHNFCPLLSFYAGEESAAVTSNTFFASLPIVDKKEARKGQSKTILHERYIECEYKLEGEQVTLLFDIVNLKIDGAIVPKYMKIYPDFGVQGRYVIENLSESKRVNTTVELITKPELGMDNTVYDIILEPGQTKVVDCTTAVSELKFMYAGKWYKFYPNHFEDVVVPKEPIVFDFGTFSVVLEPSTGFMSIANDGTKLATLVWPCAVLPYIEGVFVPRVKNLCVDLQDNYVVITEETDQYQLTRKCLISGNKMTVTTIMKCKAEGLNVRPISQIYANKGVQGYDLKSGEKEITFGASQIRHQGYEYSDYTYWETEPDRFADFKVETISLKSASSVVDITIDKKCKPVIHAPMFTSTLDFDEEKILQEQTIEQMEICYMSIK